MESDAFQALLERLDRIERLAGSEGEQDPLLDNQEFCQLLKISKRTSQSYRDSGKVEFSQIGSKVYYRKSAIDRMIEQHKIRMRS